MALDKIASHLGLEAKQDQPGHVWRLHDLKSHEPVLFQHEHGISAAAAFEKQDLLDMLLENRLVARTYDVVKNPFFGCKSLEEAMVLCDIEDAVKEEA